MGKTKTILEIKNGFRSCITAARLERKSFLAMDKPRQKDWEWKAEIAAQILLILELGKNNSYTSTSGQINGQGGFTVHVFLLYDDWVRIGFVICIFPIPENPGFVFFI